MYSVDITDVSVRVIDVNMKMLIDNGVNISHCSVSEFIYLDRINNNIDYVQVFGYWDRPTYSITCEITSLIYTKYAECDSFYVNHSLLSASWRRIFSFEGNYDNVVSY